MADLERDCRVVETMKGVDEAIRRRADLSSDPTERLSQRAYQAAYAVLKVLGEEGQVRHPNALRPVEYLDEFEDARDVLEQIEPGMVDKMTNEYSQQIMPLLERLDIVADEARKSV